MAITAIRTVILYILLMGAIRVMGKRQLGELQPTELAVTLLISDMAAVPMQNSSVPLLSGIVPILILVSLELLVSGAMLKSPRLSRLVSGNPLVLIRNGKLRQSTLKQMRMTVDDLAEALRQQGIFDPTDVQTAVVEPNGHISVVLLPKKRTLTVEDMRNGESARPVSTVVVCDGTVSRWALDLCGLDDEWLRKTLRQRG
ncbi:MAG: DUF421 domain-containing protein, partial [Acutalibacteraceae bacterium]